MYGNSIGVRLGVRPAQARPEKNLNNYCCLLSTSSYRRPFFDVLFFLRLLLFFFFCFITKIFHASFSVLIDCILIIRDLLGHAASNSGRAIKKCPASSTTAGISWLNTWERVCSRSNHLRHSPTCRSRAADSPEQTNLPNLRSLLRCDLYRAKVVSDARSSRSWEV